MSHVTFLESRVYVPHLHEGEVVAPKKQAEASDLKGKEVRKIKLAPGEAFTLKSSSIRPNTGQGWRLLAGAFRVKAVRSRSAPDSMYKDIYNHWWEVDVYPQAGTIVDVGQEIRKSFYAGCVELSPY